MTSLIQRFDANENGRDFVVGDIHGAFSLLDMALETARFDTRTDRLFSVGDLIDRGPDSLFASSMLDQPWFFAVRGNHDNDFACMSNEEIRMYASVDWNGLGWALGATDAQLNKLRHQIGELPLAIEIKTRRGTAALVHADAPQGMPWGEFTTRLEEMEPECLETALWGRKRIQNRDETGIEGIGRVFVGHTIVWNRALALGNVMAIDTGAVFKQLGASQGAITLARIDCAAEALALADSDERGVRIVEEVSQEPF